ncbi:MAG: imidazole glycerol phosphate synthase subunit HisH [bacterium]|nr:imidazole glycerol phosphate synthase subunit HisH [bacterium]
MIVIVDYGLGNLFSVQKAFEMIGVDVKVSSDPNDLAGADRIVLPGVGAFGDGMKNLKSLGFVESLTNEVIKNKKPFLGICLGLQLLADKGLENGEFDGLKWIRGVVVKNEVESFGLKRLHVGWNNINVIKESVLLKGISKNVNFYFVHGYYLDCQNKNDIVATSEYGNIFPSVIEHENIFATQFHPEKSQDDGLKILQNFVNL